MAVITLPKLIFPITQTIKNAYYPSNVRFIDPNEPALILITTPDKVTLPRVVEGEAIASFSGVTVKKTFIPRKFILQGNWSVDCIDILLSLEAAAAGAGINCKNYLAPTNSSLYTQMQLKLLSWEHSGAVISVNNQRFSVETTLEFVKI